MTAAGTPARTPVTRQAARSAPFPLLLADPGPAPACPEAPSRERDGSGRRRWLRSGVLAQAITLAPGGPAPRAPQPVQAGCPHPAHREAPPGSPQRRGQAPLSPQNPLPGSELGTQGRRPVPAPTPLSAPPQQPPKPRCPSPAPRQRPTCLRPHTDGVGFGRPCPSVLQTSR